MPSHLLPVASPVSPAVPTQGGPVHDRTADEEPQAFRFSRPAAGALRAPP